MEKSLEINIDDLLHQLQCDDRTLASSVTHKLAGVNTRYRQATKEDIEVYHAEIQQRLNASGARRSKDENFKVWENGWRENLHALGERFSEEYLKPKYFRHSKYFRYHQEIIIPENQNLEHELFDVVRDYLFGKYFQGFDHAYELGCGSCQNVYALAQRFPNLKIVASDWTKASWQIADIVNQHVDATVIGRQFDMLNPSYDDDIEPNSIVFTIHALEQLHTGFEKLIEYLLAKKPGVVLNYEPIVELYHESNLYDYLALQYSVKRGYLSGYLTKLHQLEDEGRVKIIDQYRPYIGGVYHEASLIVWKPL